jgi:GAF domain-containing protein
MTPETGGLEQVLADIHLYTDHEDDVTAVLASIAAVLKAHRPAYTWVGFYLLREPQRELVLGPYQGPPTCTTRIPLQAGMCGLAARERRTIVLPDVRADPRYIACNPAVRSEIVVPIMDGEHVRGVLDVDSNTPDAFGADDRMLLERIAADLMEKCRHGTPPSA